MPENENIILYPISGDDTEDLVINGEYRDVIFIGICADRFQ